MTPAEVMKRAKFIKHETKMIMRFDLSGIDQEDDVRRVTEYFLRMVDMMPKKSMLGLVDVSDLVVTDNVRTHLGTLTAHCNPQFVGTAILARDGGGRSRFEKAINRDDKVNIRVFGDETEAKDWLVVQVPRKRPTV